MLREYATEDLRRAGSVARRVALTSIETVALHADRELDARLIDGRTLDMSISDSAEVFVTSTLDDLAVRVSYTASAKPVPGKDEPSGEEEATALRITGVLELRYRLLDGAPGVDDEDAKAFAQINGTYNAWPYLRETLSSVTTRLGYPPFTLDPLLIGASSEDSEAP